MVTLTEWTYVALLGEAQDGFQGLSESGSGVEVTDDEVSVLFEFELYRGIAEVGRVRRQQLLVLGKRNPRVLFVRPLEDERREAAEDRWRVREDP
jgi:hypothetical protein